MNDDIKILSRPEKKSEKEDNKRDNKKTEDDTQQIIRILKLIDRCCGDKCEVSVIFK